MHLTRAIGYVRVSTDEQHHSGAGLSAQRATVEAEVIQRGWSLLDVVGEDSGASSVTLDRSGLQHALSRLDRGEAEVLVVAKLDRLSRSVAQGAEIMDRARRRGWSLVALDFGLDTTTPAGEMVANVILSTAQYERRLIGQRTREALAIRKAQGVRLGGPQMYPDGVVRRVLAERAAGRTWHTIADGLTKDGIPTARGGAVWRVSSVQGVHKSQRAADLASFSKARDAAQL